MIIIPIRIVKSAGPAATGNAHSSRRQGPVREADSPCKFSPSMNMAILDIIITGDFERISNGTLDQILQNSNPAENCCNSEWKRIIKKYKVKLTKMKMFISN
jgi:hypothetical protein